MNTYSEIFTAISKGSYVDAEKLCCTELAHRPQDENLLLLLALSVQNQGKVSEAALVYERLALLFPESSLHWNNYGVALMGLGAHAQAQKAYLKAIQLDPCNMLPRIQLGDLLVVMQKYMEARAVLLDAHALDGESRLIRIRAARVCCTCQDVDNAAALVKPWRGWMPMNDDVLQLELAQVMLLRNDVPAASEVLEDIYTRKPKDVEVQLLLATVYERLNRVADAEAMLTAISAASSAVNGEQLNKAEHLRAALDIRKQDFIGAKKILERCGPQNGTDYAHYFQLAAAYDRLGETCESMAALDHAHCLEVEERKAVSNEFYAANSLAMPLTAPRVSEEQYARWPKLIAPTMVDSPIMIVGFPRSGTTLLEQMLDAHPGLQSMDENPFFNSLANILIQHDPRIMQDLSVLRQLDCDELRKRYHSMVGEQIRRQPNTRLVDKNPLNMQWLPMIYRLFPKSKIILAVRHPCDVLLSCYMQSFRSGILVAACSTLRRLAHAYMETMECWLRQVSIFHPDVMVSRYEDLVGDFSSHSARIAQFLELDDVAPLMSFDRHALKKTYIATPSYSQVIEPINQKGIARWEKYRAHFEPLLPILDPMLRHWGYSGEIHD